MTMPMPTPPPVAPAAPSSADPTTAAAVASANAPTGQLTGSSTISSLAELKRKAPELYKQMLLGIAMNICDDMQQHQDRLKELIRDGDAEAQG
jgi:hypothetical protein